MKIKKRDEERPTLELLAKLNRKLTQLEKLKFEVAYLHEIVWSRHWEKTLTKFEEEHGKLTPKQIAAVLGVDPRRLQ